MKKYVFTVSAVYNGGESSIGKQAETYEEAKIVLKLIRNIVSKSMKKGHNKGDVVEFMIDCWIEDVYGIMIERENIFYRRIQY